MAPRSTPAEPAADATDDTAASGANSTASPGASRSAQSASEASSAPEAPASATTESAFFSWIRSTGLTRRTGWLGGVCAGIAHRTGLDPVLVRGIAVVLAVIGAPVVLLYAIAWALLPDEHGVIHAQQLARGHVSRAVPGIVAVFLLSFLPVTQGFWHVGALYWGDDGWGGAIARAIWTGVVLIAAIVLVVWLARRASAEPTVTPATTDGHPETVPTFPAGGTDAGSASSSTLAFAASAGASSEPGAPPEPPADASADELAAWKAQQEQWKQQRAEWAAEQKRTERERRQAEAHARAVEAADAARERARIRRLTRPRAHAGAVFLIVGVGLVAAALAALGASGARATESAAWVIGAATLVLTLGLGTVVLAFARRRSGALAFFSVVAVVALIGALLMPTDRQVLMPVGWHSLSAPGRYAQLAGDSSIWVENRDGAPRIVDLWQASGGIYIDLDEGATVRIDLTTTPGYSGVTLAESFIDDSRQYTFFETHNGRLSVTIGHGEPDVILKAWSRESWVRVEAARELTAPHALSAEPSSLDRHSILGVTLDPLMQGETLEPAGRDAGTAPETEPDTPEGAAP